MRRQGEYPLTNPLALRQLAAWVAIADQWPVTVAFRHNQLHLICAQCTVTILNLSGANGTGFYTLTIETINAATVAHLRNLHRQLDPDRGNDGGSGDAKQGAEPTADTGTGSAGSIGATDPD